MADDISDDGPRRPERGPRRWTSFVAPEAGPGQRVRRLHEEENPRHRVRVEHDDYTLLIHLSGEEGDGWTTLAVDRATRRWEVAQGPRQSDTAQAAYEELYGPKD